MIGITFLSSLKENDNGSVTVHFRVRTNLHFHSEIFVHQMVGVSLFITLSLMSVIFFSTPVSLGGKSAVLTALIVGLGGKAVATNRGSSLKGFVKDGQK